MSAIEHLPLREQSLRELAHWPSERLAELLALAGDVRNAASGTRISLEILYNAKKGGCSEDCAFCSQAARFSTGVEPEQLAAIDEFLTSAREAARRGASEYCMVVAVRGPSARLLERILEATQRIKAELPLRIAVSLGILTDADVRALRESTKSTTTWKPRGAISRRSARRTRSKNASKRVCS